MRRSLVRLGCLLAAPLSFAAAQASNADGVSLRASVSADTVYVGQQLTYTLSVRIPTVVRQRLRRNPEFVPPEPRAMLAYDLPLARSGEPGDDVEIHTFRRALFVLTPGNYSLGAARLTYTLPQTNSFFSREESRVLRADGVSFVAIEPPLRGRPTDWAGAVGRWTAALRAEPTSTRVGDPFVLVLRLEGTGNATLLPRPPLSIGWADVVAQDERVVLDSTPLLFGGAKEFTWLVTPREAGAQVVTRISYPTFDPARRAYVRVNSEPVRVSVRPGELAALPERRVAAAQEVALPLVAAPAGASTIRLPWLVFWTWAALLAPLPWVWWRLRGAQIRRRRRKVVETPSSPRAWLERSLRTRTGIDIAAFTAPGSLAAALQLEGVTSETAREVESLRDACDRDGYASVHPNAQGDLRTRAKALLAKVDAEARCRALLLLAMLALVACAPAAVSTEVAQAFTEGRTAYAGGDYRRAQQAFARAARLAPRDAAVWTNLGTAAWQARDTAIAVLSWQRAMRLNPRAAEPRERLARVPAPEHSAARVFPVPPIPLAVLGLALWFAGWMWFASDARALRRRKRQLFLALPGALLIAAAGYLDQRLAGRNVVVIVERSPLRTLPALGADAGAVPMTGEVAKVVERRGVWLRLELDGGRAGWFPAERTYPLTRD